MVGVHYRFEKQLQASKGQLTWSQLEAVHDDLHRSLMAACGSPRLLALAEQLTRQHNRYQRLYSLFSRHSYTVPPKSPDKSVTDLIASPGKAEHEIMDVGDELNMFHSDLIYAALDRDVDKATGILRKHLSIMIDELDNDDFWKTLASTKDGQRMDAEVVEA